MKFVILAVCEKNDWTFLEWKKNGIDASIIFKSVPKFFRAIRRFWIIKKLPMLSLWYSKDWKEKVKNADVVVIHSVSRLVSTLPQYINKLNPNAKVIAWYWNSVKYSLPPEEIKGQCDIWSFDPEDCKKYGIKFNHQYYFKSLITKPKVSLENDVFFCGQDATRGKMLMDIHSKLEKMGIKTLFQIFRPKYEGIPSKMKISYQPYQNILEDLSKSRCVIEIPKKGQSGATLRLMEALYNRKKVITTNEIIKNEPFYNSNNIFIIGERNDNELYDFIKSDYVDPCENYIDKYDVKNWLNNFITTQD